MIEHARESSNKLMTPTVPGFVETDHEIRYELPLDNRLESLAYIGIVQQETWHVDPHRHDHFELCCVEEGQGWFTIGDVYYSVNPGDLFLTKPGETHQGAAKGDSPFRLYYLGFQLGQFRSLELDFYPIDMNRVRRDEACDVKHLCDLIFMELRNRKRRADFMVHGLFMQLLAAVVRIYHDQPAEAGGEPRQLPQYLVQVLNELHSNVRANYPIDRLAESIPMSRSHLSREFKRQLGVSIGQYIRTLCIDKAKHSLRESEDSISVIAEKLHFTSIHTFSIFFKRHVGLPPQQYRKEIRKQDDHHV